MQFLSNEIFKYDLFLYDEVLAKYNLYLHLAASSGLRLIASNIYSTDRALIIALIVL